MRSFLLLTALSFLLGFSSPHEEPPASVSTTARLFEPPPPGSYELPAIQRVGEHRLLDPMGASAQLLDLAPDQVAFVSFIYRGCVDAEGCPLALAVMQRFDHDLVRTAALRSRVRLVTVSFDPAKDGPQQMGMLKHHMAPVGDWRFLTAADEEKIAPVLLDFGQEVLRSPGPKADSVVMGHLLRVFLVDGKGAVRNVYGAGFLDPGILRNDAATVLGVPSEALTGSEDDLP